MVRIKNWKLTRKYAKIEEWDNTKSNVTLKLSYSKDNPFVSLLGRGRYQPTYLVGGNSKVHVVPISTAKRYGFKRVTIAQTKKIAYNYMRSHPEG